MTTVGIRELKNRLSEYLRHVRAGGTVLVTDRGEVMAELGPPGQARTESGVPAALAVLARQGHATLGAERKTDLYPALPRPRRRPRRRSAAELLDAEREGR